MDECVICTEAYSAARVPRMLPSCGHSLCEPCLTELANRAQPESKAVECPECRQSSVIPAAGFPINYALLRAASAPVAAPAAASAPSAPPAPAALPEVKCFNCEEQTATLFCQSSCGDLCGGCSDALHRQRALRDHVVCSIADKPKPQRMCPEHKDERALLYCMKCERLACVRCGFGSHRDHGVVDAAEAVEVKRASVQQRFQYVEPNIAKLRARLAQIGEEQKLSEHERASISAAIASGADQLCQAVRARERQLLQTLNELTAVKLDGLEQHEERCVMSLSALTQLQQGLNAVQGQDALSVLEACGAWLSAARPEERVDDSSVSCGRLVSELDVAAVREVIGQWGSIVAPPPPVSQRDGGVSMLSEEKKGATPAVSRSCVLEWSEAQKSAGIELLPDDKGLQRLARHYGPGGRCHSVVSQHPLSPPSFSAISSPSSSSPNRSSVAAFEVRVDHLDWIMWIGVSGVLPPDSRAVGIVGFGVGYYSAGYVFTNGDYASRNGEEIRLAKYTDGDVIRVEVDFRAKTVAFFKNGAMQDRPLVTSELGAAIDFTQPLYAAVTMFKTGDQVTLL